MGFMNRLNFRANRVCQRKMVKNMAIQTDGLPRNWRTRLRTMKATNPKAKQAGEPVFICANYTLLTDI